MYPPKFEYFSPETLEDAIALLSKYGEEASVLAGGQSLIPLMKLRLANPKYLIHLGGIQGLSTIEEQDGMISFGALTLHAEIEDSSLVKAKLPMMHDTGIDSLIAAGMVGPEGAVIGIDMTPSMLEKARAGAGSLEHVEFLLGFGEELPVPDAWADVVISNGVVNLMPDKNEAFTEISRVLAPGGRIQIGDILVDRPVPENAKEKIELWTG